jgi:hypothetical protein
MDFFIDNHITNLLMNLKTCLFVFLGSQHGLRDSFVINYETSPQVHKQSKPIFSGSETNPSLFQQRLLTAFYYSRQSNLAAPRLKEKLLSPTKLSI